MSAPPLPKPEISVVLPCLNEKDSVGPCVIEASAAMTSGGLKGEVLVVDNGSTDGSAQIAAASGARVVFAPQTGYGSALSLGIKEAAGEFVVMADADFTYDLRQIPLLVETLLSDRADLVIGTRHDEAGGKNMPWLHRFLGTPVLSFLVSRACGGLRISDSQSGFRAFRKQSFRDLGLTSTGMEFASEMLIKAHRAGLRIQEVPCGYRQRLGGEPKLRTWHDGWRHLKLIALLAPDLVLVFPGLFALFTGLVMTVAGFLSPAGVQIGSLRWQPVFFSSISLVVGTQALLAGIILAPRSQLSAQKARERYRFAASSNFPSSCLKAGALTTLMGIGIDVFLFVVWIAEFEPIQRGYSLASLAQSLLIIGVSLLSFGFMARLLVGQNKSREEDSEA